MFWTANSKLNFVKSDGAQNVWRKEGEAFKLSCIRGTVKFGGGNVMVWESMTWNGTRKLELIDEIMGSEVYVKILFQISILPNICRLFWIKKLLHDVSKRNKN